MKHSEMKRILSYNSGTGYFVWKRPYIGKRRGVAGNKGKDGYVRIGVDKKLYLAHRLAFLYMTGNLPDKKVIHKNGDRSDNRWENLQIVNPRDPKVSRYPGVEWHDGKKQWNAKLTVDNIIHNIGNFKKEDDAYIAINATRVCFGLDPEKAHF